MAFRGLMTDAPVPGAVLVTPVMAQFPCSFAATTLNVAITSIANDLGTTISGVQTASAAVTLAIACWPRGCSSTARATFAW